MIPEILKKSILLILVLATANFSMTQNVNRPDSGLKIAITEPGADTFSNEEISYADVEGTDNTEKSLSLSAPDGTNVTINRDYFGVPHIVAESEEGVFFGQGFAAAQDRLEQMESYRRMAEGKQAELYGDSYLPSDKSIRNKYYTAYERTQIFNDFPDDIKTMFESYRNGINTYIDSITINPGKYKPQQFATTEMEPWTVNKSIAIIQFMFRKFGQFGGDELYRLGELQINGQEWFDHNRPVNDPSAPTTIHNGGGGASRKWKYSGMPVRDEVIQSIKYKQQQLETLEEMIGLPEKFGSYAVLVSPPKSISGNVMLLGCPQMGDPEQDIPSMIHEVELHCPALHVGGMVIAGIPSVIVGHNEHHAWSLTSGSSDNSDVYIDSTQDNSYSKYYHNGEWLDFEVLQDTIISKGTEHIYTHYRTIHGPVIADDLENHQVFSLKMTFWKKELDAIKSFMGMIRAANLAEFEAAAALNPFSFNLFYAGKDQKIKYWHIGKYQDRTDGVDPRLPHKGDGSEEWGGFISFENLPAAENPAQNYFVNWNNKPVSWWNNGDNIPWTGDQRVTIIDSCVQPVDNFTYNNLKDVPRQIDSHGTYQQAIEFTSSGIIDENIVPPGQSAFIDLYGNKSIHSSDQWQLHQFWRFKDQLFNYQPGSDLYPQIVFDDSQMNIGTIYTSSAPVDKTFYVHNIGENSDSVFVAIFYDTADSIALRVNPEKFKITAGDSQAITYTIDPSLLEEKTYSTSIIVDAKYSPNNFYYEKTVMFEIEAVPANIEDIREPIIKIYPNPTGNILTIEISNTGNQGLEIEILHVTGEVIFRKEYKKPSVYFVDQLDLSDYTKGLYLVKVKQANSVYIGKLVVK